MGCGELNCHGITFGSMMEAVTWCDDKGLSPKFLCQKKALVQCIQPTATMQYQATTTCLRSTEEGEI
jgi:hypothetical protein